MWQACNKSLTQFVLCKSRLIEHNVAELEEQKYKLKFTCTYLMEVTMTSPQLILGSLSVCVFETWTATGSELFSLLICPHTTTFTLLSIFSPSEISSIKILETIRSWHVECSLPVAIRVAKTYVLKLPNDSINTPVWSLYVTAFNKERLQHFFSIFL